MSTHEQVLRVASESDPNKVAGALVKFHGEGHQVVLVAIGVNAVNQMMKAAIRARTILSHDGLALSLVPTFREEVIEGRVLTAIACHAILQRSPA